MAADEAAVLLELPEVERDVGQRRREDAAGGAAREVALEGVAVEHAAAVRLDQFAGRCPGRHHLHAGPLYPARYRIAAQPRVSRPALGGAPGAALLDNVAHPPYSLDAVYRQSAA